MVSFYRINMDKYYKDKYVYDVYSKYSRQESS